MGSGGGGGLSFGKTRGAKDEAKAEQKKSGKRTPHKKALPKYDRALIPEEKIMGYSLNPARDKAPVFKSALGFTSKNGRDLIKAIKKELPYHEAIPKACDKYGQRYAVDLPITGPNGATKIVRTGWIIDAESGIARLVTAYLP